MNHKTAVFSVAVFAAIAATSIAAPQIGEKAPPVKVAKWINQQPAALPGEKGADKHVFIVEFWATWCAPCRVSIPHLAELHRKHEKDGLLILGISNEEIETITGFMSAEMTDPRDGTKKKVDMPYYVGADDEMATQAVWLKDVPGIPHAYIVDRQGLIAWAGNPLDPDADLDGVLEKVLAGEYDVEAAKNRAVADKKYKELFAGLNLAYRSKDGDKVFKILDEMLAVKPKELHPYLIKRHLLSEFDRADEIPAWNKRILDAFKDSPADLKQLVEEQLSKPTADRDAGLIVPAAVFANRAAENRDAQALQLLATVQRECGMLDAAIKSQTAALALADEEAKKEISATLEYYKNLKKLADEYKLKSVDVKE